MDPPSDRLREGGVAIRYLDKPGMFGIKRYALELLRGLAAAGIPARSQRVLVREMRLGRLRFGGLVTKTVTQAMPRRRRGLLHSASHLWDTPWTRPDVVTVHDLIQVVHPELVGLGEAGRERALRHARRSTQSATIITDCAAIKSEVVRHLDVEAERVHPVHLGLRHDVFYPDPGPRHPVYSEGSLNVFLAVNADLRKRADLVLEAAMDLPFVRVVQVGADSGSRRIAAGLAPRRRLEDALAAQARYERLARVSDEEMRRLYAGADLVVHPSAAEGFSFPPLEALACGAAVLASDIPVHREVLADAARFVRLDAQAIASELQAAWDGKRGPSRAKRLAHAAKFTWERTTRQTLRVYEEALE